MTPDEAQQKLRLLSDQADGILMRQTMPLPRDAAELLQKLAEAGWAALRQLGNACQLGDQLQFGAAFDMPMHLERLLRRLPFEDQVVVVQASHGRIAVGMPADTYTCADTVTGFFHCSDVVERAVTAEHSAGLNHDYAASSVDCAAIRTSETHRPHRFQHWMILPVRGGILA